MQAFLAFNLVYDGSVKEDGEQTSFMCIEKGTFEDLCDLYPDTALKLKRLAIQRRDDWKNLLRKKKKTKVSKPYQYREAADILVDPVTGKLITQQK